MAASNQAPEQWGITPPISTDFPTKREEEITVTMMEELRRQNMFESEADSRNREAVLGRVAALVKQFVEEVSREQNMSEEAAKLSGGKIFTFGSYRLGVHGPGSDIDTLLVVPRHVNREHFFSVFDPLLREFEGVTEVSSVPDAYVPIIKAKISGVAIDFLFARLALTVIPDDLDLKDDNLLKNLDERCVRSLGGSRVTDEILRLVPNVAVFRDALRCIKLWAQQRAIYSNVMGFCGGVAWAMLVARLCQLYPNQNAGGIVSRFFSIMFKWTWPQPVLLKAIDDGPLQVRVWNPRLYPSDRSHRMPIITPAYPSMCSTHNVTESTHKVMKEEFARGSEIMSRLINKQAQWSDLLEKHDFFEKYRYYLQVVASASSQEIHLRWEGTVESRMRQLVMKLEFVPNLERAHPFVKGFEQTLYFFNEDEQRAIGNGEITEEMARRTKADTEGKPGSGAVWITSFYIGLAVDAKPTGISGPRKLDISYPIQEFVSQLKGWEHFDEPNMGVVVRHIKNAMLPEVVFQGVPRQAGLKQGVKRSKTSKTSKPLSRSSPVSDDGPNKKRRAGVAPNESLALSNAAGANPLSLRSDGVPGSPLASVPPTVASIISPTTEQIPMSPILP